MGRRHSGMMGTGIRSLLDLTYAGMEDALRADGVHPIHAGALWRALYHDLDERPDLREDFSRRCDGGLLRSGGGVGDDGGGMRGAD